MKFLKALFLPPVFEGDEEKTRVASQLNAILWVSFFSIAILFVIRTIIDRAETQTIIFLGAFLVFVVFELILVKTRKLRVASFLIVGFTWALFMYQARNISGIRDTAFVASLIPILMAGLLLNYRYSILLVAMTIATGWWFVLLEQNGVLVPPNDKVLDLGQDYTFIFSLIAVLSVLTTRGFSNALKQAQGNYLLMVKSNADMRNLQAELEKRVEERTAELELVSLQTQERANQLLAISEVAKSIAVTQEIDKLFENITNTITEQFGFYHAGIFLLDENREYAVLQAANSEGGKRMIGKGHSLRVGAQGIVGYVALTSQPRIALDTGADAVFFNNPDLPLTHSELAVPLIAGNRTIGVLDVQSEMHNAFTEEDVTLISTLANQIAIAIENARLFEETRSALKEAQAAYSKFVQAGWAQMQSQMSNIGYQYSKGKINDLPSPMNDRYVIEALSTGEIKEEMDEDHHLAIPVKLRNEVVGVIKISLRNKEGRVSPEDLNIINTISERMALALENARLINDSQRRAARERALAQSTARIGSSVEYQTIMLSAVEELNQLIGDSEIIFQLKK